MAGKPKYVIVTRRVWNLGGGLTHTSREAVSVRRTDSSIQRYIDDPQVEVYVVGDRIPTGTKISRKEIEY